MHSGRDGVDRCLDGVDRYSPESLQRRRRGRASSRCSETHARRPVPPESGQRRDHRQQRRLQDQGVAGEGHQIGADHRRPVPPWSINRVAPGRALSQLVSFVEQFIDSATGRLATMLTD